MASSQPAYSLSFCADYAHDLEDLAKKNPVAAARLVAFFRLLGEDQRALGQLQLRKVLREEPPSSEPDHWIELRNLGFKVWRLKFPRDFDLTDIRPLFAYNETTRRYHILGIMPRDLDYQSTTSFAKRIIATYQELGLPVLPPRGSKPRGGPH